MTALIFIAMWVLVPTTIEVARRLVRRVLIRRRIIRRIGGYAR
jgi:hypothetical protein